MGDSNLNGAYYGPSIPPPSRKTYHRPGRGGGCCCNPFTCCCGCIMNLLCTCIFQILCTILVIIGVLILILWLVFRPNTINVHATQATLTEFNLDNSTLRYNLAVNFTIRNPNRRIGIYYDRIEARAFYEGQRFATVQIQPFYQGRKNSSFVSAEFTGQNLVVLGNRQVTNYNNDRTAGMYDIEVRLYLRTRLRVSFVRTARMRPNIECDLRVPLLSPNNTASSGSFESRRCDFDWR